MKLKWTKQTKAKWTMVVGNNISIVVHCYTSFYEKYYMFSIIGITEYNNIQFKTLKEAQKVGIQKVKNIITEVYNNLEISNL